MDWWLTAAVAALLAIGTGFIYSASFRLTHSSGVDYMQRQVIWLAIGLGLYLVFSGIDYRRLVAAAPAVYLVSILLLVFILAAGESRFGARRWIQLGPFTLQPSEFAKPALVLILAWHFSSKYVYSARLGYFFAPLVLAAVPALLILKQPDLGTALVLVPLVAGMALVARVRIAFLAGAAILAAAAAPAGWMTLKEYQKERVRVFLDPGLDPYGSGYTVIQSKIAIGSGRLTGKGWLSGTQNMLNFLPERQTDFIFAVLAEEWGFVGGAAVLMLYALAVFRLYRIATVSRDFMGTVLVSGFMVLFSTHVIVNVGMTMGLLPATGLPLPLLSYGGSVTAATMAMLGICQSVYIHRYYY